MRMLCFFLLLTGLAVFLPAAAWADTIETRDGRMHEGRILDEDAHTVYLDTPSGVTNIAKSKVITVNGEPYHYSGQGAVPVDAAKAASKKPSYLGRAADEDSGVPLGNVRVQFHRVGEKPKKAAASEALTKDDVIHPSGVTEAELRRYYDAHPDEFKAPVELRLKFVNAVSLQEPVEDLLKNPSQSRAWKDAGWMKKGAAFNAVFSDSEYEKIFALRKNGTVMVKDTSGVPTLFWATERKEAGLMPYHEARPKVLNKILNASRH